MRSHTQGLRAEGREGARPRYAPTVVGEDEGVAPADGGARSDPTGPTVAERAPITRERSSAAPSVLPFPEPEAVLRKAEIEQARLMGWVGVVFNVIGLAIAQLFGGDPLAKRLFMIALGIGVAYNLALVWVASSNERYRTGHLYAYFAIALVANCGILYYLGVFGPVLMMFVLNVYAACLSFGAKIARVALVSAIAPVAVIGGAIAIGLLEDPGLITPTEQLDSTGQLLVVGGFALFMIFTFQQALGVRQAMVTSLAERDEAVRRASHREALFLEARQELERALQAGGMGRFTEQTLGSFELGAVLGRGGMGEVYEATHVETGEPAAVKMLLPEMIGRPGFVRRFLREVRLAASLDSPHVVAVLEVGDEAAPIPYLAMERLEGEDLAQILRREVRLRPDAVLDLVRQVGDGVRAATEAGIVHRDLKPQNLFRTDGDPPRWKILDFGVSTLMGADGTLTDGEPIGTPEYMAPEQALGEAVDHRTDLYALAAIAYRALTGLRPFEGTEMKRVLAKVIGQMPVRPTRLAAVPAAVDAFFAIALAKDKDDRFESADALCSAFASALAGELSAEHRERARALLAEHPWAQ